MGKREQPPQKKRVSPASVLSGIAMAVCAVVMICCGIYLARLALESHQIKSQTQAAADQFVQQTSDTSPASDAASESESNSSAAEAEPAYSVDFASLQAVCPDAVGWIQVSGLDVIDYPIVHYSDDDYYLNHSWDGQASRYGAIFMEAANSGDFSDSHTLIYGHNMKDGSMFGSLKKYKEQSFYQENGGLITIYLPGETRTYQIFSVHVTSADDESVYTVGFAHDDTFGSFLEALRSSALYDTGVPVSAADNVITLSTCAGEERLVVHAKQISAVPAA